MAMNVAAGGGTSYEFGRSNGGGGGGRSVEESNTGGAACGFGNVRRVARVISSGTGSEGTTIMVSFSVSGIDSEESFGTLWTQVT